MRIGVAIIALTASVALSACKQGDGGADTAAAGGSVETTLDCAAMISAAAQLMISGQVENEPALVKRQLVTSMTYLNLYAIPKKIKEPEAFADLKARRAALLEELSPVEIVARSKVCMALSPL